VGSNNVDVIEIASNQQSFLLILGTLFQDASARITHKAAAPELDAIGWCPFVSDSIYRGDIDAIGYGMTSLDCLPG
jgi:hypothetical protein